MIGIYGRWLLEEVLMGGRERRTCLWALALAGMISIGFDMFNINV